MQPNSSCGPPTASNASELAAAAAATTSHSKGELRKQACGEIKNRPGPNLGGLGATQPAKSPLGEAGAAPRASGPTSRPAKGETTTTARNHSCHQSPVVGTARAGGLEQVSSSRNNSGQPRPARRRSNHDDNDEPANRSQPLDSHHRDPRRQISDSQQRTSDQRPVAGADLEPELRLLEQNIRRPAEPHQDRDQRGLSVKKQQQPQQARIKVTLSKPKQEDDDEQEEEARKLGEFCTAIDQPDNTGAAGSCSQRHQDSPSGLLDESSFNYQTPRTRGQSTATLISTSIEQIGELADELAQPTTQQTLLALADSSQLTALNLNTSPDPPTKRTDGKLQIDLACDRKDSSERDKLARLERDSQLRRIASQRRKEPQQAPSSSTLKQQDNSATSKTLRQPFKATRADCPVKRPDAEAEKRNFLLSSQQQQQQQLKNQDEQRATGTATQPSPTKVLGPDCVAPSKQLAIYINGKIRSNSIFCSRSVSSNSFTSILRSFHSSSAGAIESQGQSGGGEQASSDKKEATPTCEATPTRADGSAAERPEGAANATTSKANTNASGLASSKPNFANCLIQTVCKPSGESRKRRQLGPAQGIYSGGPSIRWPRFCRQASTAEADKCDKPRPEDPDQEPARTYRLNPSSMFLRKAMRYYRLWIYSANSIILLGALIFILAAIYVTSDFRFQLVVARDEVAQSTPPPTANASLRDPEQQLQHSSDAGLHQQQRHIQRAFSISLSEPPMVAAYLMLLFQLGLLQALGCFGAIRMKERLIQAFWYLILALVMIDLLFLVYWLRRYDLILSSLRQELGVRLERHYGNLSLSGSGMNSSSMDNGEHLGTNKQEVDKIFSQIIDQVQANSRCCGISNSLDYKRARWRETKVAQLRSRFLSDTTPGESDGLDELLAQLPLVPASCCRRAQDEHGAEEEQTKVIQLDDAQLLQRVRVPAWSPSMVVARRQMSGGQISSNQRASDVAAESQSDHPQQPQPQPQTQTQTQTQQTSLADVIDRRWSGQAFESGVSAESEDDAESARLNENSKKTRLLTKQMHYDSAANLGESARRELEMEFKRRRRRRAEASGRRDEQKWAVEAADCNEAAPLKPLEVSARPHGSNNDAAEKDDADEPEESRVASGGPELEPAARDEQGEAWAVESKLDQDGRVLSRLIEIIDSASSSARPEQINGIGPSSTATLDDSDSAESLELQLRRLREISTRNLTSRSHGRRERQGVLGLTSNQIGLIESYLKGELARKRKPKTKLARRSIFSPEQNTREEASEQAQPAGSAKSASKEARERRLRRLRALIGADEQLACAPRSLYDESRIYTRGCHGHIRAWLRSSANILFVMGFCVLTVLKFCSLILLRLEIREMIHKIRVLKGMATEYNALQDLEQYLPRSSVCAQAAELTPAGVTSALGASVGAGSPTAGNVVASLSNSTNLPPLSGQPGGGPPALAASCSSPTTTYVGGANTPLMPVPRRIGGSFSEAVAAATAVAHQQRLAEQQQHQQMQRHLLQYERAASLANCARAASTKTMLGGCSCAGLSSMGAAMLRAPHGPAGLCPCSSSMSMAAHLNHSASPLSGGPTHQYLQQAAPQKRQQQSGCSLRSDFLPAGSMPRRHTAVSVCPAAAAAAAAAHHLMLRRGTFSLTNPLACTQSSGQQQAAGLDSLQAAYATAAGQLPSGSSMLQAKSLNYLNHHRHSTHAVSPSQLLFGSGDTACGQTHFLLPTSKQPPPRRASSMVPGEQPQLQQQARQPTVGERDRLRALGPAGAQNPPFKRQTSGGAQSAVNFSLDIAPAGQLTESRRSIH